MRFQPEATGSAPHLALRRHVPAPSSAHPRSAARLATIAKLRSFAVGASRPDHLEGIARHARQRIGKSRNLFELAAKTGAFGAAAPMLPCADAAPAPILVANAVQGRQRPHRFRKILENAVTSNGAASFSRVSAKRSTGLPLRYERRSTAPILRFASGQQTQLQNLQRQAFLCQTRFSPNQRKGFACISAKLTPSTTKRAGTKPNRTDI